MHGYGYGFGWGPSDGFGFPRGFPARFQPRQATFWFIECDDAPVFTQLTAVYKPLETAISKAEMALHLYERWQKHHAHALDSRTLLTEQTRAMQALEGAHYGFLSARLQLAVAYEPLLRATQEMQKLLCDYLNNDVQKSFASTVAQGNHSRDPKQVPLRPYHNDLLILNINVCTLILEEAFKLLGREEFDDRNNVEYQIPGGLKNLLGTRAIITNVPVLEDRPGKHTLEGILAWIKELLNGKTKMPWGPKKGGYGFPEATSLFFSRNGWGVERVEGTKNDDGDTGEKTYFILTPPDPTKAPPTDK